MINLSDSLAVSLFGRGFYTCNGINTAFWGVPSQTSTFLLSSLIENLGFVPVLLNCQSLNQAEVLQSLGKQDDKELVRLMPELNEISKENRVLVLDNLEKLSPESQSQLEELLQHRKIGGLDFSKTPIIGLGYYQQSLADLSLGPTIRQGFVHLNLPSANELSQAHQAGVYTHDYAKRLGEDEMWDAVFVKYSALAFDYLEQSGEENPEKSITEPVLTVNDIPLANAKSYELAARLGATANYLNIDAYELLLGALGPEQGRRFAEFCQIEDISLREKWLENQKLTRLFTLPENEEEAINLFEQRTSFQRTVAEAEQASLARATSEQRLENSLKLMSFNREDPDKILDDALAAITDGQQGLPTAIEPTLEARKRSASLKRLETALGTSKKHQEIADKMIDLNLDKSIQKKPQSLTGAQEAEF